MPKRKISKEEFVELSKQKHGDKYDYSLVEYVNNITKVKIICPIHGVFEQIPKSHKNGIGCKKCSGRYEMSKDDYIKMAKKIHNNEYDYSLTNFSILTDKIKVICPKHGIFEPTAKNHIDKKSKCPQCNIEKKSLTKDEFVEKSKNVHGDDYDYSLVEYKNNITKVKIICKKCNNYFLQTPNSHYVKKQGCPFCKESKGEKTIKKYLDKKNIKYIRQKTFDGCKDLNLLPFDFYLPDYDMCIEFDGKQHFESIEYFGGDETLKYIKEHDKIKNIFCLSNGISLLRIRYDQNVEKQ
ncbi:MAG: hypothetical protein M0R46_17025 [Candidatus Muirbacterium halophilum]|nr:hypothetical protein [Candidatus Muirbacterium halophilum]